MKPLEITTFLSDKSLAQKFDTSRNTIWRWVREGNFPKPIKLTGGATRWRLADIEVWLESKEA